MVYKEVLQLVLEVGAFLGADVGLLDGSLLTLTELAAFEDRHKKSNNMSIKGLISVFTAELEIIARRHTCGDWEHFRCKPK